MSLSSKKSREFGNESIGEKVSQNGLGSSVKRKGQR